MPNEQKLPKKMSGLPPIYNPNPTVIPGEPEKVIPAKPDQKYPDSFLISLQVQPLSIKGEQSLMCKFRPYDHSHHAIYPNGDKDTTLYMEDIWKKAATSQVFAQTMGRMIVVASLLYQEFALQQMISITQDPKKLTELQQQLLEVQIALGITSPEPYPHGLKAGEHIPVFDFATTKNKGEKLKGVIYRNGDWEKPN